MDEFTNILPENFSGVFYFTNPSTEDFEGKWGKKAYLYPAEKTTPMVILDASPLEVQNIRKKFAKELAEREYFKSKEGLRQANTERNPDGSARFNSFHQASQYSDSDLKVYIQKCLEPMPMAQQLISDVPGDNIEDKLSRDEDGDMNTQIATKGRPLSLKDKEGKR